MISDNKIKHMLGVARRCRDLAESKNLSESLQNACFVMGLLHDIGYELCTEHDAPKKHPEKSKELLNAFLRYNREIINAVSRHGKAYSNLTIFDKILNEADLTTDYQGNHVDVHQRLNDIKTHCTDINKTHYEHAVKQAEALFLIQPGEIELEHTEDTAGDTYAYYASSVPDNIHAVKAISSPHESPSITHATPQNKPAHLHKASHIKSGSDNYDDNFNPLNIGSMDDDEL